MWQYVITPLGEAQEIPRLLNHAKEAPYLNISHEDRPGLCTTSRSRDNKQSTACLALSPISDQEEEPRPSSRLSVHSHRRAEHTRPRWLLRPCDAAHGPSYGAADPREFAMEGDIQKMGRRPSAWVCLRTVSTFLLGFGLGLVIHVFASLSVELARENAQNNHITDNITETQVGGPWAWGLSWGGRAALTTQADGDASRESAISSQDASIEGRRAGPRVLCYILVGPTTHKSALNVRATWGRRCDAMVFFSTKEDPELRPEVLKVQEGYGFLWAKAKAALTHLHRHYPDFDWYLKADDDTFVIVENLRYFLRDLDPKEPVYYGVKFRQHVKQGYMSGGGGYVLSREAVRRFVTEALATKDQTKCATEAVRGAEDLLLGQCLESVGVRAGDSLDASGKPRFFSHNPLSLFYKAPLVNRLHWYWRYIWHKHDVGPDCCSPHLISFHDVDARMMWTLETLLYRVRIHHEMQPPVGAATQLPGAP
ncbi:glycoprotein-N-acetylgalactosamine 3-beta-galactosyltransferase 1-like [Penaeus japonicus]|uniref:glycoprotein-N-acetylgalactosamine 3-beta-galactosyltransferase 1-like n=1 Tax=Penaeus japonicus TaxID=27405 RepID=UPI001C713450|nr:glycoprotein-N-acetylgalactosamine 3-beta-galactosyltransferase 1-like [Penaeus japonicus]